MKKAGLALLVVLSASLFAYGVWGDRLVGWAEANVPGLVPGSAAKNSADGGKATGGKHDGGDGPPVETAAARSEDIAIRRRTIGSVVSKAALSVTSTVQGMVTERVAAEGSDVAAGDLIARLDDRTAKANVDKDKATLDRDGASFKAAEDELARQQSLAGKNVVSGQSLEDAVTAVATAKATIALDQATLEADMVTLDDTQIRAPFAGRLGAYQVAVGSIVAPGGAIVPLTQMAPVDVTFDLPEADVAALRRASADGKARIDVTASTTTAVADGGDEDAGKPVAGTLSFIDSTVDAQSGTFNAKATVDNADLSLWPGQSVTVDVVLGKRTLVAVPTVAVQPAQQGSIVFVVGKDGKIAVRTVEVGLSDGDRTGLSSGLEAGDRVVTEGQIKLADGMRVRDVSAEPAAGGAGAGSEPAAPGEEIADDRHAPANGGASK